MLLNSAERAAEPEYLVYRKSTYGSALRRAFDASVATLALVAASPVLALAALAILIEDGPPVVYTQLRAGQFERLFTMFKLRTMRKEDCVDRHSPASPSDPRVTRVGRVLRRLSVDELPQLVNVVRGDMSLVGPRPEMPFVLHGYEKWQHLRHLVRPGLTCFWQVHLRSTVPLHRPEATALDIEYIRRASPRVDGMLIARTVLAIVNPKGAY
jgi:lipopolysaccharide/colanic/teichoic acid biosynthesis glycosyltransferase